jgi:hypothetical protein
MVRARYNFLYSSQARPCGRPPAAAVFGRQSCCSGVIITSIFSLINSSVNHRWQREGVEQQFSNEQTEAHRQKFEIYSSAISHLSKRYGLSARTCE